MPEMPNSDSFFKKRQHQEQEQRNGATTSNIQTTPNMPQVCLRDRLCSIG